MVLDYKLLSKIVEELPESLVNTVKLKKENKEYSIKYINETGIGVITDTWIAKQLQNAENENSANKNTSLDKAVYEIKNITLYSGLVVYLAELARNNETVNFEIYNNNLIDYDKTIKHDKSYEKGAKEKAKKFKKIYDKEIQGAFNGVDTKAEGKTEKDAKDDNTWKYNYDILAHYKFSGKIIKPKEFFKDKMAKVINKIENAEWNLYTMGPKLILMGIKGVSTGLALKRGFSEFLKTNKKINSNDLHALADEMIKRIENAGKNGKLDKEKTNNKNNEKNGGNK